MEAILRTISHSCSGKSSYKMPRQKSLDSLPNISLSLLHPPAQSRTRALRRPAHFSCELPLYCVLLHFSILPSFAAVYYSVIVQSVFYSLFAVHSVFLCVRSTSHSTVLPSLLLCFSYAALWILSYTVRKCFVLLWHSRQLSILCSEMSFSQFHHLLLWTTFRPSMILVYELLQVMG